MYNVRILSPSLLAKLQYHMGFIVFTSFLPVRDPGEELITTERWGCCSLFGDGAFGPPIHCKAKNHVYIYIYIYTYMHTYVHVCMYTCTYMYNKTCSIK